MEHNHNHEQTDYNKAFAFGITLNVIYVIIELLYGLQVNSMALVADAGHNFSDVLGLILAWGGAHLAKTATTKNRTYGFRKTTILAALFNSILLLIALGAITVESVRKIAEPESTGGTTMMVVAGIGIVINALTALLFFKGREKDLNIKGAFLHMAADAGVSLGVVVAGLFINLTSLQIIDPIISLVIVLIITFGTWGLLKDSFHLSIDAVPKDINIEDVEKYLQSLDGVKEVHDLHIWAMSTTEISLTVHLVMPDEQMDDNFLGVVCSQLNNKFRIIHSTIQIEKNAQTPSCENENI